MALNAEFFFTVHNQIISIISALGVMTGNAGYHAAISMIDNPLTHRMAEFTLAGMAPGAGGNAIPLEHGRTPAPMGHVADKTITHLFVAIFRTLMTGNGILMATFT